MQGGKAYRGELWPRRTGRSSSRWRWEWHALESAGQPCFRRPAGRQSCHTYSRLIHWSRRSALFRLKPFTISLQEQNSATKAFGSDRSAFPTRLRSSGVRRLQDRADVAGHTTAALPGLNRSKEAKSENEIFLSERAQGIDRLAQGRPRKNGHPAGTYPAPMCESLGRASMRRAPPAPPANCDPAVCYSHPARPASAGCGRTALILNHGLLLFPDQRRHAAQGEARAPDCRRALQWCVGREPNRIPAIATDHWA